jgi:uncharacterized membrane protein
MARGCATGSPGDWGQGMKDEPVLHGTGRALQLERLLFFSDAVFAIAITLLVIEIRLPNTDLTTDAALGTALRELIPHYIGFVVSFFVIGRFWQGHHRLMGFLADWDDGLVSRNILLLFTIAFLPFPTAIISEVGPSWLGVLCYAGWLALAGLANFALMRHVVHTPGLLAAPLTVAERKSLRAAWLPVLLAPCAAGAAFIHPIWGVLALSIGPFVMALLLRLVNRLT